MVETLAVLERDRPAESGEPLPSPDRVLFSSALVRIGSFRCPPDHPRFSDAPRVQSHLMAFPRSSVSITHDGGRPFVFDPAHASLYNPGQGYLRKEVSPEGDRSDWFGLAPAVVRGAYAQLHPRHADAAVPAFTSVMARTSGDLYRRQRSVFEYVRQIEDADVIAVEEVVIEILLALMGSGRREVDRSRPRRKRDVVEATKAYLAVRSTRRDSLTDVARAVGCSVFHLCRAFRAGTGSSLHQYRRRLRLRRALERVMETNEDLLTVGLALGFSGHSHFTAAFKREFGIVPSALRRRSRTELASLLARLR
ncbi:MAG TPA: AraC family transcriptional regulator [Vicinamibacterales bacterium]|nr:AraC family transcriptional regulator [Vicinamibacterales bacterium]